MRESGIVAVVGAGISGLAAAHRLQQAGLRPVVFDKSRGVGGRMATRRVGSLEFDHGAQYFTTHGDMFGDFVQRWRAAGIVANWPPQGLSGRAEGCFVGVPTMNAPAKALAEGLLVLTEKTITEVVPVDGGWRLSDETGAVSAAGIDRFDAVILAIPAPQAAPLVERSGVALPGLDRVDYAPCWALMLAAGKEAATLPEAFSPEDGAIAWVARNGAKPGRPAGPETLVVHAAPDWSRAHLESTPEEVSALLLKRLEACTHRTLEPSYIAAHRWRYALVERAAGAAFLWNEAAGLGACGDWCLGPRIEAAFDSGYALAGAILGQPHVPIGREARR